MPADPPTLSVFRYHRRTLRHSGLAEPSGPAERFGPVEPSGPVERFDQHSGLRFFLHFAPVERWHRHSQHQHSQRRRSQRRHSQRRHSQHQRCHPGRQRQHLHRFRQLPGYQCHPDCRCRRSLEQQPRSLDPSRRHRQLHCRRAGRRRQPWQRPRCPSNDTSEEIQRGRGVAGGLTVAPLLARSFTTSSPAAAAASCPWF